MRKGDFMYKIDIVDDDGKAASQLEGMIQYYGTVHNLAFKVSKYNDPTVYLKKEHTESHIIFLDIKMPQMDGIDLAKNIRVKNPDVIIIFCTSFQHFAINGYEVNAFGFLVKPVQEYSFNYFFDRAIKKLQNDIENASIRIKTLEDYRVLRVQDIYYVEVLQHYLFYHVKRHDKEKDDGRVGEEIIRSRGVMKDAEKQLSGFDFFRSNISYLLNFNYVTAIKGNNVYLSDKIFSVSRSQKKIFTEKFMEFISKKGGPQ